VVSYGYGIADDEPAAATARPSHPELADEQIVARVLAMDSLPESYRVVFMLREIDGLDTRRSASMRRAAIVWLRA